MWSVINDTLLMYKPNIVLGEPISSKVVSYRTIYGFDFDSTLVTQKSGKKFPVNGDDWKPLYSTITKKGEYSNEVVKKKLEETYQDENIVVIFSNQSGVSKNKLTIEDVKKRFDNFLKYMESSGIPIFICISLAEDQYRKPSSSMWIEMLKMLEEVIHCNTTNDMDQKINIRWDTSNSVYVGDAAGRKKSCFPVSSKRGNDFSCSDRKFAYNVGINFKTPEEFFLNEAPITNTIEMWEWGGFDPSSVDVSVSANSLAIQQRIEEEQNELQKIIEEDSNINVKHTRNIEISIESGGGCDGCDESDGEINIKEREEGQELVILVGPPSSGKTTFCKTYFPNYVYINMDTLKTKAKCKKATKDALSIGKSVIIDNTNPDKASRQLYLDLVNSTINQSPIILKDETVVNDENDENDENVGKDEKNEKEKIHVRCIMFNVSKELAIHLNMLRVKMTLGKRKKNPTVAYNVYFKKYEVPTIEEGIDEIITLPFKIKFKDELHRHLFFERT